MESEKTRLTGLLQKDLIVLCLFASVGLLIYWNSLTNFFQYDDLIYVVYNRNIQTLRNIPQFFIKPRMLASNPHMAGHYRPLVVLSYALNYAIGGLNTVSYHIFNLAFHVGSAFMIFLIVKKMLVSGKQMTDSRLNMALIASLAAGLIFLFHPFNSEAVNYITARSSVMSGFFYLTGFYCWVKFRSRKIEVRNQKLEDRSKMVFSNFLPLTSYFYLFSLLAFVAGMLSKEVVITLPIVFWLYDLYFISNKNGRRLKYLLNWRTYLPYLPFVLVVVIPYLVIRATSYGSVMPHFNRDISTQILTELPVLVKHWRMFLIPYPLSPLHSVEMSRSLWSFPVIYSSIILIFYTALAILFSRIDSRAWRVVSFFLFWFYIVLLPTTIIPLNAIFQENRGYLAAVSFAVFAGVALGELGKTIRKSLSVMMSMIIPAALLLIFIITSSIVVVQRNRVWRDELTLWSDTVKKMPRSFEAYTALGVAYRREGMYNQAFEASRKALILGGGRNFIVHDNIARIYMAQEKWDDAAKEFEKTIEYFPYFALTHNDLGKAYYEMGKPELAEKQYREAIKLDPFDNKPYYNMGVLYARQGSVEKAFQAYMRSISLDPDHIGSHLDIGVLLEEQGRKGEAVEHYRLVLQKAAGDENKDLAQAAQRRLDRLVQ